MSDYRQDPGQPPCGQVSYEENDMTGFASSFASAVNSFPVVGSLFAGLVQPSYSLRQFRCVPGDTSDHRTFYALENILIVVALVLIGITIYLNKAK